MRTSRSFPGFTAHTAAYTVHVAAVLGQTQASELMSPMSSAVSVLPKAAYLQKYWNFASERSEVMPGLLAVSLSFSAWLPAGK